MSGAAMAQVRVVYGKGRLCSPIGLAVTGAFAPLCTAIQQTLQAPSCPHCPTLSGAQPHRASPAYSVILTGHHNPQMSHHLPMQSTSPGLTLGRSKRNLPFVPLSTLAGASIIPDA